MTDLRRYGYHPGNYWCACVHCDEAFMGTKYSVRCRNCAESAAQGIEAQRAETAKQGSVADESPVSERKCAHD
jgi:hypothetical protein